MLPSKNTRLAMGIGRAAYPTSQVPIRERREPFPTSMPISPIVYAFLGIVKKDFCFLRLVEWCVILNPSVVGEG